MLELIKRVKQGDELARDEFVVANLRLVLSVVQRFSGKREKSDDMFQVGCVGLMKAIEKFKEGVKKKHFLPNKFKKSPSFSSITSTYISSFSFDSNTTSQYEGTLAEDTTYRDSNGNSRTKTTYRYIKGNKNLNQEFNGCLSNNVDSNTYSNITNKINTNNNNINNTNNNLFTTTNNNPKQIINNINNNPNKLSTPHLQSSQQKQNNVFDNEIINNK